MNRYTISVALKEAADILHKAGIEDGRREAGILMEHFLGISRERLLMELQEVFPLESKQRFFDLITIRSKNFPLQYITGEQEFMGFPFKVTPNVLIPRRETEELVQSVLDLGLSKGVKLADIGTGSGAIAISIAKFRPDIKVFATDISQEALNVARNNALKLDASVEFLEGDLLQPLFQRNIRLDAIVSNPPYISISEMKDLMPEVRCEPPLALEAGKDGLDYYRRLAQDAPQVLGKNGKVFLEIGMKQGESIRKILSDAGFKKITVIKDYQGRDRIITAILGA